MQLSYHPATKEVVEHHVAVYAARNEDKIVRAPHPEELLVHSVATPSIVAAIMNAKYTNAMPLYRISQEMDRYDVKISVPTIQTSGKEVHCLPSIGEDLFPLCLGGRMEGTVPRRTLYPPPETHKTSGGGLPNPPYCLRNKRLSDCHTHKTPDF